LQNKNEKKITRDVIHPWNNFIFLEIFLTLMYTKSQLWKIHGKWYDLSNYMRRHPGGEEIIKQT
jgi:hypothetical protein